MQSSMIICVVLSLMYVLHQSQAKVVDTNQDHHPKHANHQPKKELLCAVPATFQPVCGSDGHTYINWGALECVRNRGRPDLVKLHDGKCVMYGGGAYFDGSNRIINQPRLLLKDHGYVVPQDVHSYV